MDPITLGAAALLAAWAFVSGCGESDNKGSVSKQPSNTEPGGMPPSPPIDASPTEPSTPPSVSTPGTNSSSGRSHCASGIDPSRLASYFAQAVCTPFSGQDAFVDSDGDGIPDAIEAGIINRGETYIDPETGIEKLRWYWAPDEANCSCRNTLTCWYLTDTDNDGIMDSKDNYPVFDFGKLVNQLPHEITVATDGFDINDFNTNGSALYFVGGNPGHPLPGFNLRPDANDADSDSDGLLDGMEDRSRHFDIDKPAYLMFLDSLNGSFLRDDHGERIRCDLTTMSDREIGISYNLYVLSAQNSPWHAPMLFDAVATAINCTTDQLQVLACVNETVAAPHNFNGIFDLGRGESNARDVDTDSDCVCDGSGPGCATIADRRDILNSAGEFCRITHTSSEFYLDPLFTNDQCPEVPAHTSQCAALNHD